MCRITKNKMILAIWKYHLITSSTCPSEHVEQRGTTTNKYVPNNTGTLDSSPVGPRKPDGSF